MDVLTFRDARTRLAAVMDKVVRDRAPVVIARDGPEAVVVVSLADWNALEETRHLVSSPANARRLAATIDQLKTGAGTERDLIET